MLTNNTPSRRSFLIGATSLTAVAIATPSFAISQNAAESLVNNLIKQVMGKINSGKSGNALYKDFEKIFATYADVPLIARKALGPAYKSASKAQQAAYVAAFKGFMARFYGKRFNEFKGGKITVTKSKKAAGGYLVDTNVALSGRSPFLTQWHVVDKRGKPVMYNLYIEGVSLLSDVRTQIGAMLDKRGGNIDKLIAHLKTAG